MTCSSSAVLPNPASPRNTSTPLCSPRAPASSPSSSARSSLRPRIGISGAEGGNPTPGHPTPPRELWRGALADDQRARHARGLVGRDRAVELVLAWLERDG